MYLKTSLKQLWYESKANPVFTALYIGGVTFAVVCTMLFAMLFYTQIARVYPEYNRDKTLHLISLQIRNESNMTSRQQTINPLFVKDHLSDLKNCEALSITCMNYPVYVRRTDGKSDLRMLSAQTDPDFFKIYEYEFVAGESYTDADMQSDIPVVIITDRVAQTLFGSPDDAVGRDISIDFTDCRIRGVVREGSSINPRSFSHIFRPVSMDQFSHSDNAGMKDYLGRFTVVMKVSAPDRIPALKDEINDIVRRINAADTDGWEMTIMSMPSDMDSAFGYNGIDYESFIQNIRTYLIILLTLLIIPAINISGMIGGQMSRRMAEMGLRRSFGADRRSLCGQVMFENLVLTLVGGAIGLVLTWIILVMFQNQIFGLLSSDSTLYNIAPPRVTSEMLFAPAVFVGTLIICIILNILSAYVPVRMALRRPIVSSLNCKK